MWERLHRIGIEITEIFPAYCWQSAKQDWIRMISLPGCACGHGSQTTYISWYSLLAEPPEFLSLSEKRILNN